MDWFGLRDGARPFVSLFKDMPFFEYFLQNATSMEWRCERRFDQRIQTSLDRPDSDFLIMAYFRALQM
jgi:hypothetical protein